MSEVLVATELFTEKLLSMLPAGEAAPAAAILEAVEEIRELKRKKNAVILSHFYMPAELQITEADGGIADYVGDSLGLSVAATKVEAENIIFCGVKFMAETAKILNPDKQVLLPSMLAGCSLAESITAADVRSLKAKHPGVPVVAYINTYAETKAEADICCTSRNAMDIARSFEGDELIFLPDLFMGRNLQSKIKAETGKNLILWEGKCEVHEQFTPQRIKGLQLMYPEAEVLVHWEVPDKTVAESLQRGGGIVGSTSDIIRHVGESSAQQFILGSECDLGATLRGMYPQKEFIVPCIKCPHMKQIDLFRTLDALRALGTPEEAAFRIELDEQVRQKAYIPIERMLAFA
ncbi:MAG: quinolinate synthase NadA [Hymenobacteraceae bacterium]|nr:quinolinate synthase NadA [Hymenobacteraceae bacterium]MDX5396451.1 quinolinate synthase NadA [Hymenobacteraceae bacterium]MDX5442567.1 quinolinate synthase NadA [Hymenobacteraceae bacterium]MDX5512512.1 quinolinate synthase NadA [Hymenobacteraceae bacterium]